MTVRFEVATEAQVPRLHAALARLSQDLGDTHRAGVDELRRAGFGAHPAFRAVLASEAGETLGVALYSPSFSTARGGVVVYVSDLWVDAQTRGSGLGPRLLAAVLRDAQACWGGGADEAQRLPCHAARPQFLRASGLHPGRGPDRDAS